MSKDQPYNTLDLQAQEDARLDAESKAKMRARVEIDDLRSVMGNKRGRRFVYGVLERAGVFRSSFNTNALTMAFNEGARNEGLVMLAKLTANCFDLYTLMMKEATDE
jgi:hypothetical protein